MKIISQFISKQGLSEILVTSSVFIGVAVSLAGTDNGKMFEITKSPNNESSNHSSLIRGSQRGFGGGRYGFRGGRIPSEGSNTFDIKENKLQGEAKRIPDSGVAKPRYGYRGGSHDRPALSHLEIQEYTARLASN